MELDEHFLQLGKLMANLHGLEFALRAFLHKHHEDTEPIVTQGDTTVGALVPENSFTNYDNLQKLCLSQLGRRSSEQPDCYDGRCHFGRLALPTFGLTQITSAAPSSATSLSRTNRDGLSDKPNRSSIRPTNRADPTKCFVASETGARFASSTRIRAYEA